MSALTIPEQLRGIARSLIHFFVFTSLYIAVCALVMIHQANHLLQLQYNHFHFGVFVLFATLCSYNFHWGLTSNTETTLVRLGWTIRHRSLHVFLFIVGAIGAGIYFFYFLEHWFALSISVLLTFLYSAPKVPFLTFLRKIAIGKTIFLSMVWTYVTSILPLLLDGRHWSLTDLLFCASRFFFIYSICILFDYRDRDWDRQEGIRSMITYFDERGVDRLFAASIASFALLTIGLYFSGMPLLPVILIMIPGIIMIPLFKIGKKNFSDYLYYIVLDGMMMLSAILTSLFI